MRNIARTRQAKREPESGPGGQIDRPPPQPPPTPRTYPPATPPGVHQAQRVLRRMTARFLSAPP